MNELALFAGAGGGILGGKVLGWRTVCAVEINAFCARRLMQRQNEGHIPPFPIWDDVCTFDGSEWRGIVDVVSGGFPCQAYSTAASGRNNADDLWPEMRRIVADVAPRHVFAENVSKRAINGACDDLEKMGYKTSAVAISAADMGADHVRVRYWLRAYTDHESKLFCEINAEMEMLQRVCARLWKSYTGGSRIPDGLANRLDRYKATGNGQIPVSFAAAWRILGGP